MRRGRRESDGMLTLPGRLDASRLLAFGGISLVLVGMLLGEIYAIYISHVANSVIKDHWAGVIEAASRTDTTVIKAHFTVIKDLIEKRARFMNTHSHMGAFGLLALAMAFLQPVLALHSRLKRGLAVVFLSGAVLQFGGVYLSYYLGPWLLYLSDFGALLFILAIGGNLYGLLRRHIGAEPSIGELVREQLAPAASRFLLRAGVLLILAGMTFGLYYAWYLVSQDEPQVYHSISAAADKLSQGDVQAATDLVARFKAAQSKIAITAAAHSHAIEFGFLIVLLAFIQRFVLLSEVWRLRWAKVLVTGAFLLPVSVYFATIYGLRAAAFADLFGGLMILGLLAMGVGVIRQTALSDLETGETG